MYTSLLELALFVFHCCDGKCAVGLGFSCFAEEMFLLSAGMV